MDSSGDISLLPQKEQLWLKVAAKAAHQCNFAFFTLTPQILHLYSFDLSTVTF